MPPYVIFHDASLVAMAERRPRSLDEFAAVPGVGATKLERYGETFLEVIRAHGDDGDAHAGDPSTAGAVAGAAVPGDLG